MGKNYEPVDIGITRSLYPMSMIGQALDELEASRETIRTLTRSYINAVDREQKMRHLKTVAIIANHMLREQRDFAVDYIKDSDDEYAISCIESALTRIKRKHMDKPVEVEFNEKIQPVHRQAVDGDSDSVTEQKVGEESGETDGPGVGESEEERRARGYVGS